MVNQSATSLTPTAQQSTANSFLFSILFPVSPISLFWNHCHHYDPSFSSRKSGPTSHTLLFIPTSYLSASISTNSFVVVAVFISCHRPLRLPARFLNLGQGPDNSYHHFFTSSIGGKGAPMGNYSGTASLHLTVWVKNTRCTFTFVWNTLIQCLLIFIVSWMPWPENHPLTIECKLPPKVFKSNPDFILHSW